MFSLALNEKTHFNAKQPWSNYDEMKEESRVQNKRMLFVNRNNKSRGAGNPSDSKRFPQCLQPNGNNKISSRVQPAIYSKADELESL